MTAARSDDAGTGAVVVLPVALVSLFVVTLLAVGVWRVTVASAGVADAARAGGRALVEAPSGAPVGAIVATARSAAVAAAVDAGLDADVGVVASRRRCAEVAVTVRATVAPLRLPWVDDLGATTVSATHSEVLDPHRAGLVGVADCVGPA